MQKNNEGLCIANRIFKGFDRSIYFYFLHLAIPFIRDILEFATYTICVKIQTATENLYFADMFGINCKRKPMKNKFT